MDRQVPSLAAITKANQASRAQREEVSKAAAQVASQENFEEWTELAAFNPLVQTRRFKTLEERGQKRVKQTQTEKSEQEEETETATTVQDIEEVSEQFQKNNAELKKRSLLDLRSQIKEGDTKEQILEKVLKAYPDPSLADEALNFLAQTTQGELREQVLAAKAKLNSQFEREILAGHNMGIEARRYAEKGLGDASTLRDVYREITGNPKEPLVLFDEFAKHFDFERLQPLIGFLLHSLGRDLKAKGPSIPRAELMRLVTETRTMQAILGIYRYFKGSMFRIARAFERAGLDLPPKLEFELMSKLFVKLLQERYPNTDKIMQLAKQLGVTKEILAQIIVLTHMKNGLRQVAPKLFRSQKHKKDLQLLFIEALEDLEDALEEEEDDDDEEEDQE